MDKVQKHLHRCITCLNNKHRIILILGGKSFQHSRNGLMNLNDEQNEKDIYNPHSDTSEDSILSRMKTSAMWSENPLIFCLRILLLNLLLLLYAILWMLAFVLSLPSMILWWLTSHLMKLIEQLSL